MTNELSDLNVIFNALSYASKMHSTQRRKDNRDTPYINHPIDVARMLVTTGGITDSDTLAAAIMHSTGQTGIQSPIPSQTSATMVYDIFRTPH